MDRESFILASSSPRRAELLDMIGARFRIVTAGVEETLASNIGPAEQVMRLARLKADAARKLCPDTAWIVAADTMVWLEGELLGKPKGPDEAEAMLRKLSGRWHRVYTGIAICGIRETVSDAEETAVHFLPLEDEEIFRYVASGEAADKAGAYGIQGRGALFVDRIEGDFYNVMGLPLCRLRAAARRAGLGL